MFNSILIICTANICRSPMAERILRKQLVHKKVDSAGVKALVGHAADESAVIISEKNGVSLDGHFGQQFDSNLAKHYDLILVMERNHIEQLGRIAPEARGKAMLLGHWINEREIPDPYRKSDEAFESVYKLIEKSCNEWSKRLSN